MTAGPGTHLRRQREVALQRASEASVGPGGGWKILSLSTVAHSVSIGGRLCPAARTGSGKPESSFSSKGRLTRSVPKLGSYAASLSGSYTTWSGAVEVRQGAWG